MCPQQVRLWPCVTTTPPSSAVTPCALQSPSVLGPMRSTPPRPTSPHPTAPRPTRSVLELTYQDGKWVYPAHSMTAAASGSLAAPASAGSTLTISPSSYSSTHFKAAAALHSNGHPLGPYLSGRHSGSVRVIGGLQRGSAPSSTASGAGTPLARAAPGSGGLSVPPSPCDSAYHAHMLRHSSGAQPVVTGGAGAAAPGAGWTRPPAGPSYRAASGALPQIPSGSLPSGTTLPPIPAPAARARSGELSPRAHLGAARPGAAPMQPHG